MQSAMMAHINEHIAFEYRKQMEAEMGVELPFHPNDDQEDRVMPEEVEVRISQLAAKASQVLLQRDTNEMRAQQAQQAAQDPIIQMQQQEQAIKAKEVAIKEKKLVTDAAAKADQLQIERERIEAQKQIAGMNAQVKVASDDKNRDAKLVVDLAKTRANAAKQNQPTKGNE
jgi:hypothetical protein